LKKKIMIPVFIIIVLVGGYLVFDYYVGNHIEIVSVLNSAPTPTKASVPTATNTNNLEKKWTLLPESKVYATVQTSKEAVNIKFSTVTGDWDFNLDPTKMSGQATVKVESIDSGNSARDNDLLGSAYLHASKYPDATFKFESIEDWNKNWIDDQMQKFKLIGTLTINGVPKKVSFDVEAKHSGEKLLLSGKTKITFADFGMFNPHNIVLDTENDIYIRLEIAFGK
jgi:polyisoprenoid-binding protein YceI